MNKFIRVVAGCVLGALSIVTLSSCSKMEQIEKNIVGNWRSTRMDYKTYEDGKLDNNESETCVEWYVGYTFKSDHTGQEIWGGDGESTSYPMTWMITGNKLMISYTEDPEDYKTFNIISISGNSMTLDEVYERTRSDGSQFKEVYTFYLKKMK